MATLDGEITRARVILADAIREHRPVAILAAYSGGNDSMVSTHFTMTNVPTLWRQFAIPEGYECPSPRPLHINTGIGIPATREHARKACRDLGWDLWEETTPESYEDMVLGKVRGYPGGFPGPAMHGRMYIMLKQRAVEAAMRRAKAGHKRSARVLIVSGIRADESRIRAGYQATEHRVGSQVWLNPFYHATHAHFDEYRARFGLPRNPVKDVVGISGECLCGAYAHPGELLLVEKTCPATGAYLRDLQCRVREAGFPWNWDDEGPPAWWKDSRRGQGLLSGMSSGLDGDSRPMCNSCEKVRSLT